MILGGEKETAALIGRAQGGGIITEEGNPYRTALFGDAAGAQPCPVAPGGNKWLAGWKKRSVSTGHLADTPRARLFHLTPLSQPKGQKIAGARFIAPLRYNARL